MPWGQGQWEAVWWTAAPGRNLISQAVAEVGGELACVCGPLPTVAMRPHIPNTCPGSILVWRNGLLSFTSLLPLSLGSTSFRIERKRFLKWLHHFTFPLAVYEDSIFSTISSTMIVAIWIFVSSCPNGYEVVSHCGFDLHFQDDWPWYFHVCYW